MLTSGVGHGAETGQTVADHLAGRIKAALGEIRNRVVAETDDPAQLQADRLALWCGCDAGDERLLPRRSATSLAAGALATDVGVIKLHASDQVLGGVTLHHDLGQLVLELPGRALPHAEAATQLDAGDALLALRQVVHRAEPEMQRQMRRGENGARDR